ncbi:hypothetical protein ABT009_40615 [Streptomyces sp. NPDC002896]|uniref:hypothetical protein n=1 Tax=Streptomyces sp. NPDC002896 TaxID=3154438 RepID=UPI00332BD2E8
MLEARRSAVTRMPAGDISPAHRLIREGKALLPATCGRTRAVLLSYEAGSSPGKRNAPRTP